MADVVNATVDAVNATVAAAAEAAAGSETGLYVAYAALLVMAVVPIWVGSHMSLAPKSEVITLATIGSVHADYNGGSSEQRRKNTAGGAE